MADDHALYFEALRSCSTDALSSLINWRANAWRYDRRGCEIQKATSSSGLEPTSPAIVAAAQNQQYDDDDQKGRSIHDALLRSSVGGTLYTI